MENSIYSRPSLTLTATESPTKYPVPASASYSLPDDGHSVSLAFAPPARAGMQRAQRVCDVALCLLLLALLLPLFLLIALLVRLDSPGPVLFIQPRVGKHGEEFPFFKFRSMVADAEARRLTLEQHNERSGPVFKIKNDPRITRSGRLLRKYSLDELPQLLNVLRGEMSLIGPRPALPREVAQYTAHQRGRLGITPGVTGLWQVSGRARVSFERSVELDLHYIEHQSVWLNVRILVMTIPAVLKGDGAY
jgi:lipopolysaccharide/colanic/teichoic acid biosynthesis glycosyltransferase